MRRLSLLAACLFFLWSSALAQAAPAQLSIWSASDTADLLPGQHLLVVVELRSDDRQMATITQPAPAGLVLEAVDPSSGMLAALDLYPRTGAASSIITWTGEVSATQPVNIRLVYHVPPGTTAGDRTLTASGQAAGVSLSASTLIRVCCTPAPPVAPPPVYRRYLPVVR